MSQQRLFSPFPYCFLDASLSKPEKPLPVQLSAGGSWEKEGQTLQEFAGANFDGQFRNQIAPSKLCSETVLCSHSNMTEYERRAG